MPNHKSTWKRMRQNAKRRMRNKSIRSNVKTVSKAVRIAVEKKKSIEEVEALLLRAVKTLDKAGSKGVIPKKRASRKISRLNLFVNKYRTQVQSAEG